MARDERDSVEAALANYVDRLNAGERVLPEEVLFDYPELGDEILERLEVWVGATHGGAPGDTTEPLGELGDYTLERRIGRGGMGVVYAAWQKSLERRVALKILPSPVAVDDRAFVRFMREAKMAGKLKHPGIVPVYGTGVEADTPYFAMEYIEGETLAQIIERSRREGVEARSTISPVPGDRAACSCIALAFADVAEALQHAHGRLSRRHGVGLRSACPAAGARQQRRRRRGTRHLVRRAAALLRPLAVAGALGGRD